MKCRSILLLNLLAGLSVSPGVTAQEAGGEESPAPQDPPAQVEAHAQAEVSPILTPLAVGNTWRYRDSETRAVTTETIVEARAFDGHPWYRIESIETTPDDPKINEEVLYEGDWWLAHFDGVEADASAELDERGEAVNALTSINHTYRYPAEVGEIYQPYPDLEETWIEVMALDQATVTPAGAFDCIVYREFSKEDDDWAFTTYFAPGVGIVRMVDEDENGDTWESVLISYELVQEGEAGEAARDAADDDADAPGVPPTPR